MATKFDRAHTDDLLSFLRAAPTPFHAAAEAAARLERAGFVRLAETDSWADGAATGARYVLRGGALVAWYLPPEAEGPAVPARRHPHRLAEPAGSKPCCRTPARRSWRQVSVEVYGGALYNSWLDRDLGLAGRLVLRDGTERLVNLERPLLRVPQLAVHLDRSVNTEGLKLNAQQHLMPIWGLGEAHEGDLISFVAAESNLRAEDVLGWDLMTYDVNPPAYLGRDAEFVASARLDNLVSVHASVAALTVRRCRSRPIPAAGALDPGHLRDGPRGDRLQLLHRRERPVPRDGARTAARGPRRRQRGAGPRVRRVVRGLVGHGPRRAPELRRAATTARTAPAPTAARCSRMKCESKRYATSGRGQGVWARACERAGTPWQTFVSRNDLPCGTTIGPPHRDPAGHRDLRRRRLRPVHALRPGAVRLRRPVDPWPRRCTRVPAAVKT